MADVNIRELAAELAEKEGLEKSLSIAQILELLGIIGNRWRFKKSSTVIAELEAIVSRSGLRSEHREVQEDRIRHSTMDTLEEIRSRCMTADEEELMCWSLALDGMLDNLTEHDFFGTEGQLDPRGDQREKSRFCARGDTIPNPL